MNTTGKIVGINGNLVSVRVEGSVVMNEVAYITLGDKRLKCEVIRIRGDLAQMQVFEITKGIGIGSPVEFSGEMLSVELGPGLLGQVYDGLQNPLPELAERAGFFLERGVYLDALERKRKWDFQPKVAEGDRVSAGDCLGVVPEGPFEHRIMVPLLRGRRIHGQFGKARRFLYGSGDRRPGRRRAGRYGRFLHDFRLAG